jgi:2,4-dienoyl-CoA reductase-like NADH-dependent reductase (Old Yellow Enzyme family)
MTLGHRAASFPPLLSPKKDGPVILRSRMVPMWVGTGYTNRGRIEIEDVAYHGRRAAGRTALTITGGSAIAAGAQRCSRRRIDSATV